MSRSTAIAALGVVLVAAAVVVLAARADRAVVPAAVPAGFGSSAVTPSTARTDGWATVQDLGPRLDEGSDNACERGEPVCLDHVLDEMAARLAADGCAHTAPFAFTYQEMTRGVRDAVLAPGFFALPAATVHADALFARQYFTAYDNWAAGRHDEVPPAWRLAFGAAERPTPSAATNLLLGMNAHIARDLPYVVAEIASWQAEAGTDGGDYVRINDVIAEVKGPMLAAAAERFDPTLVLLDLPLPAIAGTEEVDLIGQWRDQAFERGVRLAQASTPGERAEVEGQIEREATATATLLLNAGTSNPGPVAPAARDAYCEDNR